VTQCQAVPEAWSSNIELFIVVLWWIKMLITYFSDSVYFCQYQSRKEDHLRNVSREDAVNSTHWLSLGRLERDFPSRPFFRFHPLSSTRLLTVWTWAFPVAAARVWKRTTAPRRVFTVPERVYCSGLKSHLFSCFSSTFCTDCQLDCVIVNWMVVSWRFAASFHSWNAHKMTFEMT